MAEQSRDRYAVSGSSPQEMANGLNFILARISDRLDQIEGLRGVPSFYKNYFDFSSPDGSLTAGQVLKATSTTRAEMVALDVSDISGAAPDISSGSSAQIDIEMSLISMVDWENDTVVHQFPTQWLEYNTEVSMFYTQEGPTVLNTYGDVTGPVSATDNNLAQFNGTTGKVIEDSGLSNTDVSSAVSLKHTRSHAITGTSDHTSSATSGQMLKADASGLPIDASNTDAAVAVAVSASHARSHALDGTSDHSIGSLTNTYLVKSDGTNLVPATNTDAQISAAVTASHAAVSVSAPISLSGQALSLVNDVVATVTEIDTGTLANSDTVVPTSKAVTTAIAGARASSISDGDTGHSPDGNSVFDALALKAPLASPTFTGLIGFGGTNYWASAAALADTGTVTLPTITANYPAHGFIHCAHASTGVISESAEFEFGSTGEVQIIRGTANIEAGGATAGKISLGPVVDANPVVIKNNLGGGVSVNAMITLWYH